MPYDLSALSVAILDSNSFSRRLMHSLLGAIGVPPSQVREFSDAESTLAELKHFVPDLILCEISLKGMNGIEFTQAVRQIDDESKCYVPIIVCTAQTDEKHVIACRDAGAHEVLTKPMSVETLYQRIVSVIEHPRSFIHASVFAGPDRRRREVPEPGQARRSADMDS